MAKGMILADVHLGVPGRLDDITWSLNVSLDYATEYNLNPILVLGDLFHNRVSTETDVLCRAWDFFAECKRRGKRIITFPGNHDMFLRHSWVINSLRPFASIIDVIETVKLLTIDDVRFWVLPFIQYESAFMRVLHKIEEQHQEGDVLLTHIGIMGAIKNTCFLLKDWSVVSFEASPFQQVFTGHFHTPQQVGNNAWYPGSLIPFKFDEGDSPHGFMVYDFETRKHEFVDIWEAGLELRPDERQPPNYYTVPESMLDEVPDDVFQGNLVRVAMEDEKSPNEKNDLKQSLMGRGARAIAWMQPKQDEPVVTKAHISAGGKELFESWLKVDGDNTKNLKLSLLRRLNADVVREGNERYNYEDE